MITYNLLRHAADFVRQHISLHTYADAVHLLSGGTRASPTKICCRESDYRLTATSQQRLEVLYIGSHIDVLQRQPDIWHLRLCHALEISRSQNYIICRCTGPNRCIPLDSHCNRPRPSTHADSAWQIQFLHIPNSFLNYRRDIASIIDDEVDPCCTCNQQRLGPVSKCARHVRASYQSVLIMRSSLAFLLLAAAVGVAAQDASPSKGKSPQVPPPLHHVAVCAPVHLPLVRECL